MRRKTIETIGWFIIGINILFLALLPSILLILHDIENSPK